MAKTPADRFSDTQEFADSLTLTGPVPATSPKPNRSRPAPRSRRWLVPLGALGIVVLLGLLEATTRMGRGLWARTRVIPAIQRSVTTGDWEGAYRLASKVDRILPGDSTVAALRAVFADTMRIEGTPRGAAVYRRSYVRSERLAVSGAGSYPARYPPPPATGLPVPVRGTRIRQRLRHRRTQPGCRKRKVAAAVRAGSRRCRTSGHGPGSRRRGLPRYSPASCAVGDTAGLLPRSPGDHQPRVPGLRRFRWIPAAGVLGASIRAGRARVSAGKRR